MKAKSKTPIINHFCYPERAVAANEDPYDTAEPRQAPRLYFQLLINTKITTNKEVS